MDKSASPSTADLRHAPLARLVAVVNAAADSRAADDTGADLHRAVGAALTELTADGRRYPAEAIDAVAHCLPRFDPVFDAVEVDAAAAVINSLLADSSGVPRVSNHDGSGWHVHSDRVPFSWRDWFVASSALALAVALGGNGRLDWGRCARPGCERVFENTGSGAPRLYCSASCGSRVRVARQRRQHQSTGLQK